MVIKVIIAVLGLVRTLWRSFRLRSMTLLCPNQPSRYYKIVRLFALFLLIFGLVVGGFLTIQNGILVFNTQSVIAQTSDTEELKKSWLQVKDDYNNFKTKLEKFINELDQKKLQNDEPSQAIYLSRNLITKIALNDLIKSLTTFEEELNSSSLKEKNNLSSELENIKNKLNHLENILLKPTENELTVEEVVEIQKGLTSWGIDNIIVDGHFGENTFNAIKQWLYNYKIKEIEDSINIIEHNLGLKIASIWQFLGFFLWISALVFCFLIVFSILKVKLLKMLRKKYQKPSPTTQSNNNREETDELNKLKSYINVLVRDVNELKTKNQELEKELQKIKPAETNKKQGIEVIGGLDNQQIKTLDISQEELIKIYNDVPKIFLEYAHPVSLTSDTYREKTEGEIYLESTPNGKYWLIATESDKKLKYWLVPNGNIKIKLHRLKSIQKLFKFEGKTPKSTSEFILEELAMLSILPSGEQWKLEKIGVLSLQEKNPLNQTESNYNREEIVNSKLSELENQLNLFQKENQNIKRENQELHREIEDIKHQIKQLQQINHQSKSLTKTKQLNAKVNETPKLEEKIKVGFTVETIENAFAGNINAVVLEKNERGKFTIIKNNPSYDYLELAFNTKLHFTDLDIIKKTNLFECSGNSENPIRFIKAPKVRSIKSGQTWELIEPGELYFD